MRYFFAKLLFRASFPRGRITVCDMRPGHDAMLVNLSVCLADRLRGRDLERRIAHRRWSDVLRWCHRFSWCFEQGDRMQIFIGYSSPPSRLLHGCIAVEELRCPGFTTKEPVGGALVDPAK